MTALAAALALALAQPAPVDLYAVLIGFNGGLPASTGTPLPELRFADDDALRLARWFSALAPPERVFLLADPDGQTRATWEAAGLPLPALRRPTRSALFEALDEIQRALAARPKGREAAVVLFYAGHGLTGRLLLAPEAGQQAGLTGRELKAAAARLPADQVVVLLDACRSQSLFVERGQAGPDLTAEIRALESKEGEARVGVITAAASDRPAGEAAALQGGFFSHVLASGLAGAADADGDGVVRFGELAAYAAFNTERLTGQRPWFEPPRGDLRAPVVALERAAGLLLPAGAQGRVRVATRSGAPLFAEVNKAGAAALKLALPPGSYLLVRRSGPSVGRAARVEVVSGPALAVSEDAFGEEVAWSQGPLERGEAADQGYDAAGFTAPFSADAVTALEVGYTAGREPAREAVRRWAHALDVAYAAGPAPLGLPSLEQGAELGYRFAHGWGFFGARAVFRAAPFPNAALFRVGASLFGGARVAPLQWLELSGHASAGLKALWVELPSRTAGDVLVPVAGLGLRAEAALAPHLAVWLEGRLEASFPRVDAARAVSWEPAGVLGLSVRQ